MSLDAYRKNHARVAAPRDAEYRAFSEATQRLIAVDSEAADLKSLSEALHANKMLWGILADDCASASNALPPSTRAQIIALSRWVENHSRAVLRRKERVGPLVDINRMMMDGLSGRAAPAGESAVG